jgi:hypothetical protein
MGLYACMVTMLMLPVAQHVYNSVCISYTENLKRLSQAIADETFFPNFPFLTAINYIEQNDWADARFSVAD